MKQKQQKRTIRDEIIDIFSKITNFALKKRTKKAKEDPYPKTTLVKTPQPSSSPSSRTVLSFSATAPP